MPQAVVLPIQEVPASHVPDVDPGTVNEVVQNIGTSNHPLWREFLMAVATKPEHVFMWFMLIGLLFIWLSLLWSWHQNKHNKVNLQDLIMVNGKLDESKMNRFVAFVISSWGFIFLLVTSRFTDWYFMGYMAAWVSNALFSNYLRQRDKDLDMQYKLAMEKMALDSATNIEEIDVEEYDESGDKK
jgi:hypothetical protein